MLNDLLRVFVTQMVELQPLEPTTVLAEMVALCLLVRAVMVVEVGMAVLGKALGAEAVLVVILALVVLAETLG
jgi:hypothetical protein